MDKKYYLLILLSLGLLTRFIFFGHPDQTVFDEVHFGKFISGYYTREYFFDIHPPLGKLGIAGFAKIFNFQPGFAFAEIGNEYPDNQYLILRFLPALAGAFLPLVIYLLALEMGFNPFSALVAGLFIVLENALLVQSIYILMDAFLLLFGFLALLFYFKYKKANDRLPVTNYQLLLFGLFSGLAISIKWTGLGFLALPLLVELINSLREGRFRKTPKLLVPVLAAIAVYFAIFTVHLQILNRSGPGDAFMKPGFQKTLQGSKYMEQGDVVPSNIFQKFFELNIEMYKANQRLDATHPYSSKWYEWPLMSRPIYYWVKGDGRIYLLGNPVIWWASSIAVLFSIIYYILRITVKKYFDKIYLFLLGGYVLNLLPFIGVKRVMFLYHYFTAYIFAIMILVWLISQNKNSKVIFGVLLLASIASFIYFSPLSYGLELSPKTYEARVWLDSWK